MINSSIELQAKMYVFDLNNCAKEFWFKNDENWELCLASGEQKAELEGRYYPTLSKRGNPETLFKLHSLVLSSIQKENSALNMVTSDDRTEAPEFLIAFNRNRLR